VSGRKCRHEVNTVAGTLREGDRRGAYARASRPSHAFCLSHLIYPAGRKLAEPPPAAARPLPLGQPGTVTWPKAARSNCARRFDEQLGLAQVACMRAQVTAGTGGRCASSLRDAHRPEESPARARRHSSKNDIPPPKAHPRCRRGAADRRKSGEQITVVRSHNWSRGRITLSRRPGRGRLLAARQPFGLGVRSRVTEVASV